MYLIIEITYKSVDSNSRDATAKCIENVYSYGRISAALDRIASRSGIILQSQPWEIEKPLNQYTDNPILDANYVMFDDPFSFTVYRPKEKGYMRSHVVLRQIKRIMLSQYDLSSRAPEEIVHAAVQDEIIHVEEPAPEKKEESKDESRPSHPLHVKIIPR
jgi:hypothetical protein